MMCVTQMSLSALLHLLDFEMKNKEYITDFDQLYDSMMKCKKGVSWKPSVKSFVLNDLENIHRMERQLKNGTWKMEHRVPLKLCIQRKETD